ncbi:hypothetical protein BFP72_10550 [Reichenbachiella sp. 5M10]|uniref:SIMPL domain-containing protein n=1 Tax=Reichenbachiella sp. 5M10 TaxID=1889772 RepID=UPI000C14A83D|nr:SIMPL domain-containing protein [Reichenbachiella sp. 5M10]PIB35801.1 hypothetical protein BFP72_10550 [Reichenbachiella sp. 5M10]
MKKVFLFLAALTISTWAWSQNPSLIHVTGQSELSLSPEVTVLSYSISANDKSYDAAVTALNTRINQLTGNLKKSGFKTEEIKTSQFNIRKSKIYEGGKVKGEEYIATQSLTVRFPFDKKRLLNALDRTADEDAAPNLSISFELSDEQKNKSRNTLLQNAMEDALVKAQILSQQAGYQIAGVQEVSNNAIPSRPMVRAMEFDAVQSMAQSKMADYQPQDLTISEQVSVTYLIQKTTEEEE